MEDKKVAIPDEEINKISDVLEKEVENNDSIRLVREVSNAETKEDLEKIKPLDESEEKTDLEKEIEKDKLEGKIVEEKLDESEETINKFKNDANLPLEEVSAILEINKRLKNKEKFSVYNALPPYFKNKIKLESAKLGINPNDHHIMNMMARSAIETLISEANIDKGFKELQDELSKVTNIPNIPDLYAENLKEMMENKLMESSEFYKESKPELSEKLKKISAEFTSAYMLDKQYKYIEENKSKLTKFMKYSKQDRFNRLCDDFDFIMDKSNFKHGSVKSIYGALDFINMTDTEIRYYIILLCLICRNMDYNDIYNVTFMYYSVRLIENLRYIGLNKATDFSRLIVSNIKQLNKLIDETITKQLEV